MTVSIYIVSYSFVIWLTNGRPSTRIWHLFLLWLYIVCPWPYSNIEMATRSFRSMEVREA